MFLIVGACPVRHCFSNIWFIFKGRIVYSLSLCIHNHLTSIRFSSGDLVGKNTKFILWWYFCMISLTFLDLCIDTLSSTRNICCLHVWWNPETDLPFYFCSSVYTFDHLYDRRHQMYWEFLLSFVLFLSWTVWNTIWCTTVCLCCNRSFFLILI